ncbi:MAG: hypothetical protein JSR80_02390 [Verrucomicrobia bacterium]|nr:hypothetical protein [Verrucomicrobiota bacterium]
MKVNKEAVGKGAVSIGVIAGLAAGALLGLGAKERWDTVAKGLLEASAAFTFGGTIVYFVGVKQRKKRDFTLGR